ncbi:MAG: hypothetical protein IV100_17850 [Myxococcales bacterium]|nr:hypothetical protein [Myxococcales bacterium]
MAIHTVGAAGTYPFTKAGIDSAIAACSPGDTVRLLDSGTISVSSYIYVYPAITIEGDPALYNGVDKTTLPKLQASGSTRCFGIDAAGCSIKNLQMEDFLIDSAGFGGGAINGLGRALGSLESLRFINCASAIQTGSGGTIRDIQCGNVGRLLYEWTGVDLAVWEITQRAGYDYVIDCGADTTGVYALGAVYQDGSRTNHSVANLAGSGPTMRNISAHRAAGAGGTAFKGTYSYCTQTGYNTLGSGTDGGNNHTRDPLFTDAPNGDFTFQESSSEIDSGTAISGVTTDMVGQSLPVGAGWPRGSRDLAPPPPELVTVTALSPTTIALSWDSAMTDDADLIDAANYSVGNAAIARVTRIDADTVHLHFDDPLAPGAHAVSAAGMTSTAGGVAAAASSVTATRRIRTWLQGSHYQDTAATIRLTVDPSGTPATYDWSITAGTVWKSLDLMVVSWQAALGTAAWVELVPDTATHRAHVRVNTAGGETYSIAWSHAGDGTAVRDRLGESGNVSGRATATVWTSPVQAGWYGWHGATRLHRKSTRPLATRREMLSGTHSETQHGAIPSELGTVQIDVLLRWGPPPDSSNGYGGHDAFEAFLTQLWDATGGSEPWSIYHLPDDENSPERYEVAFADADLTLQPKRISGRPDRLFELALDLVADVAP